MGKGASVETGWRGSREGWLQAGYQALIDSGIDCLQGYYFGAPTIVPPWRSPGTAAKRF